MPRPAASAWGDEGQPSQLDSTVSPSEPVSNPFKPEDPPCPGEETPPLAVQLVETVKGSRAACPRSSAERPKVKSFSYLSVSIHFFNNSKSKQVNDTVTI